MVQVMTTMKVTSVKSKTNQASVRLSLLCLPSGFLWRSRGPIQRLCPIMASFSWSQSGKYGKILQKKRNGVCRSILNLILKNWKDQKLRRNIEIDGGLIFFNFQFPKSRTFLIFIILGLIETTGSP